jgi:hypothetical protein
MVLDDFILRCPKQVIRSVSFVFLCDIEESYILGCKQLIVVFGKSQQDKSLKPRN